MSIALDMNEQLIINIVDNKDVVDAFTFACLVALVACRPDGVLDLDLEDQHQEFDGDFVGSVTGSYSFTDPDGNKHFVRWVADEDGYRVIESNAVPATLDGVQANGEQGSFVSLEDLEDDD
ncbi:uncharacterized protein LOC143017524 [Oratosquilla oratoria]|uniref:uncharacterized protein LOC143017524 n=1 Tax=Oratosquilla oratoria TaxID=337810 RepID=UPI003F75C29C